MIRNLYLKYILLYFSLAFTCYEASGQCTTASVSSSSLCVGDTLVAELSGNTPVEIAWQLNGTTVSSSFPSAWNPASSIVAGGNGVGSNPNQLSGASGICVDKSGGLFIADYSNNRVVYWAQGATTGVVVAGGNGAGSGANQLNHPVDLALDGNGYLYVADENNNRVQKFPPGSTSATNGVTVAGGNGAGSNPNQFNEPDGLFVDHNGDIYVSDLNNQRVLVFPPNSTSGTSGYNVAGDDTVTLFNAPAGLSRTDGGALIIADGDYVRFLNIADTAHEIAYQLDLGVDFTTSVYIDTVGDIYANSPISNNIVDYDNNNQQNTLLSNVPCTRICLDQQGNIYASSNSAVYKYSPSSISNVSYVTGTYGSYTAVAISFSGCSATSSPFVIDTPPTVNIALIGPDTVCAGPTGGAFSFTSSTVRAGNSPTYQWSINGQAAPNGNNSGFSNSAFPARGDVVNCILTSTIGCVATSNNIGVHVNPYLSVNITSGSQCTGDVLTANLDLTPAVLKWQLNGNTIDSVYPSWNPNGVTVAGGSYGPDDYQVEVPQGIFVDDSGNVYIADYGNNRIDKYIEGLYSTTLIGNTGSPASLHWPKGVIGDRAGNIYVADWGNNRVVKFPAYNPDSYGTGIGGGFDGPVAVFLDAAGNVYVLDQGNNRVVKYPSDSTSVSSGIIVAGGNGSGSGANQFNSPAGLYVDANGNIYVGDQNNHRVQKFPAGSTSATNGVTVAGGNGNGSNANQLSYPTEVFVDRLGNVFVDDNDNYRVQEWPVGASSGITVAGGEVSGPGPEQIANSYGMWMDSLDNIYVSDDNNYRVQKYALTGIMNTYVTKASGSYTATASSIAGCSASSSAFSVNTNVQPSISIAAIGGNAVCAGSAGGAFSFTSAVTNGGASPAYQWYINGQAASNGNAPGFSGSTFKNGDVVTCTVTTSVGCPAGSNALILRVNSLSSATVSSSSQYVGDTLAATITGPEEALVWNLDGSAKQTTTAAWNPNGVTVAGGNGVGTGANQLEAPTGVVVDLSGNLYISDAFSTVGYGSNRVVEWAPGATSGVVVAGGNEQGAAAGQFYNPTGLFVDATGNIYVADSKNNRIQLFTPGAGLGVTVAGGNGSGSGANQFNVAADVFVDGSGNIYVSDQGNFRVQKWAPGAVSGTTVAGGNGPGNKANQLDAPAGIYVDGNGDIYVVDDFECRVQKWAAGATTGTTVAGGNGCGSNANQLEELTGVYVDGVGNVYVADNGNNRIQMWAPGATSGITIAGGHGSGSAANQLNNPYNLCLDTLGNLYVADYGNSRVQKFSLSAIPNTYITGSTGNYTAAVTSFAGCSNTSATYTVDPTLSPIINIAASPGSIICAGTSVTLTASVTDGGTSPTFNWFVNGTSVQNSTSSTYTSSAFQNNTTIKCVITAYSGQVQTTDTSNQIVVTVNPIISPSVQITATTGICANSTISFSANPTNGGTAPSYQWQSNGTNVGTTSATYSSNTFSNGDLITCVLTSNANCLNASSATSNAITLNVDTPGAVFIHSNGPTTFCQDSSVVLMVPPGAIYQWNNSDTGSSITVRNSGNYQVTVTNSKGCPVASQIVPVTVNQAPIVIIDNSGSNAVCPNHADTLTASGGQFYVWSDGDSTATTVAATGGNYYVTVTNQFGCSSIGLMGLSVNPVVIASGQTSICQGDSLPLIATEASSVVWSTGSTSFSIEVKPPVTTTYYLTAISSNGCTYYDSVTITVNSLTTTPVTQMLPANNSTGLFLPFNLSWIPGENNSYYDLYIWKSDIAMPASPFATIVNAVSYPLTTTSGLLYDTTYSWMIVSHNGSCVQVNSPVQQFSLEKLPDLTVTNISGAFTAVAGQTTSVSWTVKNAGPGNTVPDQEWTDALFIATDTLDLLQRIINNDIVFSYSETHELGDLEELFVFPASPQLVGALKNVSALDSGQSYTNSLTFTLPPTYSGQVYYFVVTNYGDVIPEITVANDTIHTDTPLIVTLPPLPDMQVTVINNPVTSFSGDTIPLNYTVRNYGAATRDTEWLDQIYLSSQLYLDLNQAYSLATVYHNSHVDADSSYSISMPIILPNNIFGNYFIYVVTNATQSIYEGPAQNLNVSSNPIQLYLTPTPQLTASGINIPASASITQPVSFNWTVTNTGFTAAPNDFPADFENSVYLSTDGSGLNFDNAFFAGQYPQGLNSLTAGEVFSQSLSFKVPDTLSSGAYYTYIFPNSDSAVFEYPDVYNIVRSDTTILINRPDLTVTSVQAPATGVSGQPISVSYSILNNGPGSIFTHPRNDKIYVSALPVLDNTATLVDSLIYSEPVFAGSALNKTAQVTLPNGISGSWYVFVYTNADSLVRETNENNNVGSAADTVSVTLAPNPDLVVDSIGATNPAGIYDNISFRIVIKNQGSGAASGSWTDNIYIATQSTWNNPDTILLIQDSVTNTIAVNGEYVDSGQVSIPIQTLLKHGIPGASASSATLYLYVVTDYNGQLYEGNNLNNNISAGYPITILFPDLTPTSVTTPDTLTTGKPFTISWAVADSGATIGGYPVWYDNVYLSPDTVLDSRAMNILNVQNAGALGSYQSYQQMQSALCPVVSPGKYYVIVETNTGNNIPFDNITNNTFVNRGANGAPKTIQVDSVALADLHDTILSCPASVLLGQPLTFVYSVTNKGQVITNTSSWTDGIWLSTGFIPGNTHGAYLGPFNNATALLSGQSYTDTFTAQIPVTTAPGDYVLIVQTNSNRSVIEGNTANNLAFAYVTIANPAPCDLTTGAITAPDTILEGSSFNLSYQLQNIGFNAANGTETDGIYLSADSSWDSQDVLLTTIQNNVSINPLSYASISLTPLLQGVTAGNYYIIAKANILNNMLEIDYSNNAGISVLPVYVKVKNLPLNTSMPDSLNNTTDLFYQLVPPDSMVGGTIQVNLTGDSVNGVNQVYIGTGYVPSAGNFDYTFNNAYAANQQIIIANLTASAYYIVISGTDNVKQPQPVSLLATPLGFAIANVNSNQGGNFGNVTIEINGALFANNMQATLRNDANSTVINAVNFFYINSTRVYATFNLAGAALGSYDVSLTKSNGKIAVLTQGFSIVAPTAAQNGPASGASTGESGSGNAPGCNPGLPNGYFYNFYYSFDAPPKVYAPEHPTLDFMAASTLGALTGLGGGQGGPVLTSDVISPPQPLYINMVINYGNKGIIDMPAPKKTLWGFIAGDQVQITAQLIKQLENGGYFFDALDSYFAAGIAMNTEYNSGGTIYNADGNAIQITFGEADGPPGILRAGGTGQIQVTIELSANTPTDANLIVFLQ